MGLVTKRVESPTADIDQIEPPDLSKRRFAGFASPAYDDMDKKLDLNRFLVSNPDATFLMRVEGEAMSGAAISSGDCLIVDRSLPMRDGQIVVAALDGEMVVRRLRIEKNHFYLVMEEKGQEPRAREITVETDFSMWGVATSIIHRL